MGDSTCVLQPCSYTCSAIPHESKQENSLLMHGLGDSVSFGRFMTESLAWEKWSTFSSSSSSSHNRYVEEAERYAQPGSVAQKKAFFEAHYKRIAAAKKAAADAAAASTNNTDAASAEAVPAVTNHQAPPPLPPPPPPPLAAVAEVEIKGVESKLEGPGVVETEAEAEMIPHVGLEVKEDSTSNSNLVPESLENQRTVPAGSEEHPPVIAKSLLPEQNCSSDQQAPQLVKSKKKSAFSSLKSSVCSKTLIIPSSPAKQPSIRPRTSKQDNTNIGNYNATTPILRKKQALDFTDNKQNCTPKKSSPVKQLCNVFSPGRRANSRKTDNASSRIAPDSSSSKTSQNCATPKMENAAKLPNTDSSMETPRSARIRFSLALLKIIQVRQGNLSWSTGTKWKKFSAVYTKSLTACRNKLQSPILSSTSFQLRTEERAARRKQKLEDKFNSKDVEKVQPQQTSLKEKAELELRKVRQSFCFKARPLPDFYKEREAQTNQIKKINPVATQPKSPKLGRKPSFRTMQPSKVSSSTNTENKNDSTISHISSGNKNGPPSASSLSLQEMINLENASPKIQY